MLNIKNYPLDPSCNFNLANLLQKRINLTKQFIITKEQKNMEHLNLFFQH